MIFLVRFVSCRFLRSLFWGWILRFHRDVSSMLLVDFQASVCWSLAAVEVRQETFQNPSGPEMAMPKTLKKKLHVEGKPFKNGPQLGLVNYYCYKKHSATKAVSRRLYPRFLENKDADGKSRNLGKKLLHFSQRVDWNLSVWNPLAGWRFGPCHHKGVGCTRSQGSSIWCIKVKGLVGLDLKSWGWNAWRVGE